MIVKLLTEYHLEFRSFKGGCIGSSEFSLVKMSNSWRPHAAAQLIVLTYHILHCLLTNAVMQF